MGSSLELKVFADLIEDTIFPKKTVVKEL